MGEVFMEAVKLTELININSLKKMAENIYAIAGIHMSVVGVDGTIEMAAGWEDICTMYHRVNPTTCKLCLISKKYVNRHIEEGKYVSYKCENNMRNIAIPIVISGKHIGSIFFSQFFYENEVIDIERFRAQALEFGFDEKDYLEALSRVPILSKDKVDHIIEYYKGLIMTLAESGLRQLEYKNSQNELEKSQKYLNTIFNSVNDAIFIHDFYGNILDANQTATSMFGYSRNELINMNVDAIIYKKASYGNLNLENLLKQVNKKNPLIIELVCRNKKNIQFWVEVNVRVININKEGRFIVTARNITQRKEAELTLHNKTVELEKLRTEFFANISHELKTPLNIILGTIKLCTMNLENETVDREKIIKNINMEKQNCYRLLRLINNLIDSTKLDTGYFEVSMVNCNIVNIIEEITLSVVEYMKINHITLTFDTEVEEKIVACDLDKIERIMLNILSNAIKFTSPGGNIFVNIYDGEEFITISIEDTGIGIPNEKLNIIFDRFRQVDKSFTRNYQGSGIGLSLVKSLVEMQGGTISAESECGIGTKFIIKFPVKLLDKNSSKENLKLFDGNLNTNVERIKVEFSDIYAI